MDYVFLQVAFEILEQKSIVGAQQALPPATLNSVTSVPSFRHGVPASKSLAITFSNVLPTMACTS